MMNKIEVIKINKCVEVVIEQILNFHSYALGFCVKAGSRNENPKNNGISHFIEHMLFKGTPKRTAKQISVEIEKNGAYLNAFTSKESTCYYARGIKGSIGKSFEILADMFRNSLFDENEIKKEANVILDELNDISDTPEELIFDEFEKKIYGLRSLGLPVIGSKKNIENFGRENLISYFDKKYNNGKLYIVVVGNFERERILELVNKYIGAKKCKTVSPKISVSENNCGSFTSVFRNVNQYYSIIGRRSKGFREQKYLLIRLLSIILGEGSSSRLFVKLREEKGIAYQINSFVNGYSDASTFGVYFSTNPTKSKEAADLIYKELNKISRKGAGKTELQKAKKILLSNIILGIEDLTNRMTRIANAYIFSGKIKRLEEIEKELENVKLEEVNDFARELFDPEYFSQIEISDSLMR